MLSSARLLVARFSLSSDRCHSSSTSSLQASREKVRAWLQRLQRIDPMRRCFYDHMAAHLPPQLQVRRA